MSQTQKISGARQETQGVKGRNLPMVGSVQGRWEGGRPAWGRSSSIPFLLLGAKRLICGLTSAHRLRAYDLSGQWDALPKISPAAKPAWGTFGQRSYLSAEPSLHQISLNPTPTSTGAHILYVVLWLLRSLPAPGLTRLCFNSIPSLSHSFSLREKLCIWILIHSTRTRLGIQSPSCTAILIIMPVAKACCTHKCFVGSIWKNYMRNLSVPEYCQIARLYSFQISWLFGGIIKVNYSVLMKV